MDNEVIITLTFHAMSDDPIEALRRCMAFLNPDEKTSVWPQEMTATVKPR